MGERNLRKGDHVEDLAVVVVVVVVVVIKTAKGSIADPNDT
jgi:hypothetical protein